MLEPDARAEEFGIEVLKLLLQVAWADDEIADSEVATLLEFAAGLGLGESSLTQVEEYLKGEAPLPTPNLGLLRQRRPEVMKIVKRLLESDAHVSAQEDEILSQLSALLK